MNNIKNIINKLSVWHGVVGVFLIYLTVGFIFHIQPNHTLEILESKEETLDAEEKDLCMTEGFDNENLDYGQETYEALFDYEGGDQDKLSYLQERLFDLQSELWFRQSGIIERQDETADRIDEIVDYLDEIVDYLEVVAKRQDVIVDYIDGLADYADEIADYIEGNL